MRDDPIVVLSQPRAGSTLMLRLLNTCDGVLIAGEHGGPLHKVAYAYLQFEKIRNRPSSGYNMDIPEEEFRRRLKSPEEFTATVGGVRIEDIRELTRSFVRAIGNPTGTTAERWGFKEVVTPDIGECVAELFPKAQIVCMVRDPVECINSILRTGWWGRHLEWIIDEVWMNKLKNFQALAHNYPGHVRLMRFERRSTDLPDIFAWLGLTWTAQHQALLDGQRVGSADTVGSQPDWGLTDSEKELVRSKCQEYYVT